jgi:small-conductance mechanosensitive channel
MTLTSIILTLIIYKIFKNIFTTFSKTDIPWQNTIRKKLGLKTNDSIPELIFLRLVFYIMLFGGFYIFILYAWGISPTSIHTISDTIFEGFKIGKIKIIPSRIISSLLLLSSFLILTRWIRHYVFNNKHFFKGNIGAREASAVIFGYIGVVISFLFALIIAGINLSGLAIIFGALSVGIGFGLQNIVNNFVSGLILLIERPIKTGDRIVVSGIEGHVKKIRIRSTQIRSTEEFFDVIVPNSELISQKVTNLMFHDYIGRISVFVGVEYGTDIDLVRDILFKIAYDNKEVIPEKAEVFLKEFCDSSIYFELRCVIRDIDCKNQVKSDLHFALRKAFKKKNITIPFPQQDVNFKTDLPIISKS